MKFLLLLLLLLLSACGPVKNDVQNRDGGGNLTTYARSLVGVPYKFGGNSPDSGFDCSGFVGHVFRHTREIDLPRKSEKIRLVGQAISSTNLQSGDLVFFNTLQRKFSHVGIYLGDDRFIHAPSSGGRVRIENLRAAYWAQRYNGARRIAWRE